MKSIDKQHFLPYGIGVPPSVTPIVGILVHWRVRNLLTHRIKFRVAHTMRPICLPILNRHHITPDR
jgi:hypothetical protein